MKIRNHFKNGNGVSNSKLLTIVFIFTLFGSYCYGQTVIQQQQQQVIVNPVVIEKPVYIERFRTVYRDRPQPTRTARRLSAPVQLLGFLWIHTQDLGEFRQHPHEVIRSINAQNPYGRNNWRIPTADELAVMEANADRIGLGSGIYLATSHSNGILRLVSTGKTVAEQETERARLAEVRRIEDDRRRREAEDRRLAEERRRREVEAQRRRAQVTVGNIVWAAYNFGSNSISQAGIFAGASPANNSRLIIEDTDKSNSPTRMYFRQGRRFDFPDGGYRLPTRQEATELIASIVRSERLVIDRNVVYRYTMTNGNTLYVPFERVNGNFRDVHFILQSERATDGPVSISYVLSFPYRDEGPPPAPRILQSRTNGAWHWLNGYIRFVNRREFM